MRTTRAAAYLSWDAPSVNVRWRAAVGMTIVTDLVTRSLVSRRRQRLLRKAILDRASHCQMNLKRLNVRPV